MTSASLYSGSCFSMKHASASSAWNMPLCVPMFFMRCGRFVTDKSCTPAILLNVHSLETTVNNIESSHEIIKYRQCIVVDRVATPPRMRQPPGTRRVVPGVGWDRGNNTPRFNFAPHNLMCFIRNSRQTINSSN